jgi:hypothetical protein
MRQSLIDRIACRNTSRKIGEQNPGALSAAVKQSDIALYFHVPIPYEAAITSRLAARWNGQFQSADRGADAAQSPGQLSPDA